MMRRQDPNTGTNIGMDEIKSRRLTELIIGTYPDLYVGQCVPFYFCPRSVMLYLIHKNNHPKVNYHGGQEPIVHLEANLYEVIEWAEQNQKRWAFTLSNAGSRYVEFRNSRSQLNEIDWEAVQTNDWKTVKDSKQAEFLVEMKFSWQLVKKNGVCSENIKLKVDKHLSEQLNKPKVILKTDWYY